MTIPATAREPMTQGGIPVAAAGAGAGPVGLTGGASLGATATVLRAPSFNGASHSWQYSCRGETLTPHWGQKVSPSSGCSKKLPHTLQ